MAKKPPSKKPSSTPILPRRVSKLSLVKDTLLSFIDNKKQEISSSINTNSATVFIFKWVVDHWVTISLILIIAFFAIKYQLSQESLREVQLNAEIQALNLDLEALKKERAIFLSRIKDLQKAKSTNLAETKKIKESASKLDSNGKKRLLLEYKDRLMKKRAI